MNIFADTLRELAASGNIVIVHLEDWTILEPTTVIGAGVDSFLENVCLPAVDEVTVEPITRRVAIGPHERLLVTGPPAGEFVGVPDDLVEETDHVYRVC